MPSRTLNHRAPLLWLTLPYMAGIASGVPVLKLQPGQAWHWSILAAALVLASGSLALAGRFRKLWAITLAAALTLAGNAGYLLNRNRLPAWDRFRPTYVRISLRIDHVFLQSDPRKAAGTATIAAADTRFAGLMGQRGYYHLTLKKGQAQPDRSEQVLVSGRLSAASLEPGGATFDGFLAGLGMNFQLTQGRLVAIKRPPSAYRGFCERLAERINAVLGRGLERHPELAGIYRAMMLGRKKDLRPEQTQLFLKSGSMHLFAINGVHIGIVAAALHAFFALLRLPRLPASVLELAILWLDVDTTGESPSAVRAFAMVAAIELAAALKLARSPLSALSLSALLALLIFPMDFFGASFRMSYAVVASILLYGLPLAESLRHRFPPSPDLPEASWTWRHSLAAVLREHLFAAAGIGVAAALAGAISGIEYFGMLAPSGLAANLLLVPMASLVLDAGCASVLCGLIGASAMSTLFNHAAGILLRLMVALMKTGTRLPCAFFEAHFRSEWIGPFALAAFITSLVAGYVFRWRPERGGWWTPPAVVALTLIFGVKYG